MQIIGRHVLIAAGLLAADVAPESPSCGCDSSESSASEVVGTALITAITDAPANENNCEVDPVHVEFDFLPRADLSNPFPEKDKGQRLLVGAGKNPARAFLERKGYEVGSTLTCSKHIEGDSVTYRFPGPELDDYEQDCFKSR